MSGIAFGLRGRLVFTGGLTHPHRVMVTGHPAVNGVTAHVHHPRTCFRFPATAPRSGGSDRRRAGRAFGGADLPDRFGQVAVLPAVGAAPAAPDPGGLAVAGADAGSDRKSTRLNS